MRSDVGLKSKKKDAKGSIPSTEVAEQGASEAVAEDIQDKFLLRYEINEKGIGRLLLPPSLSLLLQSDRVAVSPSAGGLFIRSV